MLGLVTEEELTSEIEQADAYKEGIYTAMIRIDKCVRAFNMHASTDTLEPGRTPVPVEKVKLPKLIL